MYDQTRITQLGTWKVARKHNNKQKLCDLFVVLGNGQAILGLQDIEVLNILTINCNAIGTKETDRDASCSINTAITQDAGNEQCYTNTRQEPSMPRKIQYKQDSNLN